MEKLIKKIKKAGLVFICGNGGSASTAEHFTNDLLSKGVRSVCLNSNVSIITMLANDFGYEHIFSEQLRVLGKKDDLLITISCSGQSPNIVNAQKMGKKMGMEVYKFEIFEEDEDYESLENKHLTLVHKIKQAL